MYFLNEIIVRWVLKLKSIYNKVFDNVNKFIEFVNVIFKYIF